jgi:hypothetical protein
MGHVESLFNEVEVLEAASACKLNAQNVHAAHIVTEVGALEDGTVGHDEIITVKYAERDTAGQEEGRARLVELKRKLADAKYESSVIDS